MIAYINGKILEKFDKTIIVVANNIGYEISLAGPEIEKRKIGDNISLYTYTYIREDQIAIYGFVSDEELIFFKKLITSVPGVGPKTAMELLAVPLAKLKAAILAEDLVSLTAVPGIGKKTAERIILELKGKYEILAGSERGYKGIGHTIDENVIEALTRLGYQKNHIQTILRGMPENIAGAENIIKYFFQNV
ncbi:Holliday junction branch migration protein RuvA [Candidatus Peregrinibacteria bacterium]|nr:Holliday junction branch migration protein RuvA [Candidatus Peregrinibacteria bacterium]